MTQDNTHWMHYDYLQEKGIEMIDINELRRLAQAATSGEWYVERGNYIYGRIEVTDGEEEWHPVIACTDDDETNVDFEANAAFIAAANPATVIELLDRLEAAEKEIESWKGLAQQFGNELDTVRAKIIEMEEPVAQVGVHKTGGNAGIAWSARPLNDFDSLPLLREGDRLYLAPGAQPAQKAVAYLDLGVGGYMDIGTDLNDEQLASLPKGRHMLGIVGTYGVDGYVSAQPAPSIPEGWKLVPIEPTQEMRDAWELAPVCEYADAVFRCAYREMLAAAPEAKP